MPTLRKMFVSAYYIAVIFVVRFYCACYVEASYIFSCFIGKYQCFGVIVHHLNHCIGTADIIIALHRHAQSPMIGHFPGAVVLGNNQWKTGAHTLGYGQTETLVARWVHHCVEGMQMRVYVVAVAKSEEMHTVVHPFSCSQLPESC